MAEQYVNNDEFEDEFGDFEQADELEEKKESEFLPQENPSLFAQAEFKQQEIPLESISKNENNEGEPEENKVEANIQTKEIKELNPGKLF